MSASAFHSIMRLLVILITQALFNHAALASTLVIKDDFSMQSLADHSEFLCSPDNNATPPEQSDGWRPIRGGKVNFGLNRNTCWFRFGLASQAQQRKRLWLEVDYPPLDEVDFFMQTNKNWVLIQSGDSIPYDDKPIKIRDYAFAFDLDPGKEKTFYVRVRTTSVMNVPLQLMGEQKFFARSLLNEWASGIFSGVILGLMLLNLSLFAITREKSYLYCVLHVVCVLFFFYCFDGNAYSLWPHAVHWNSIAMNVFGYLAMIFACAFTAEYLMIPKVTRISQLLNALMVVGVVLILAAFVTPVHWTPLLFVLYLLSCA
ncbi:MAG TPA: 7TM-DISM domain-containing protein, partial [Pseudomonadales bacterium]|nr:7TM-DISM domain-containing protein [Pseudomonadales bacterium]